MKLLGEAGEGELQPRELFSGRISVDASPCYDFLVSLRALYNLRTYERAARWGRAARGALDREAYRAGKLFFEGGETSLGLGLLRFIPTLGAGSGPSDLIERIRSESVDSCVMLMIDTGELTEEALEFYRSVLHGRNGPDAELRREARRYSGVLASRALEVLLDPVGSRDSLTSFLERYLEQVFAPTVASIRNVVQNAAAFSKGLLEMRPTLSSVEALTGGYTLSAALRMNEVVLAPSVFVYPFTVARVDEERSQALIVFGIKNDELLGYEGSSSEDVLDGVKALANVHRLQIIELLRSEPRLGSEFVKLLGLGQPTVHHHLAQLRSARLIRQERTNEGMLYSFRPDNAQLLIARLTQFFGIEE